MINETRVNLKHLLEDIRDSYTSPLEEYHILLAVGLVLSEFLDPEKHPQEFLQRFLASWGQLKAGEETLF